MMQRIVLGSLAGGLAIWLVWFVCWGPLLGWIPYSTLPDANAAALQEAMKTQLSAAGSGAYRIPWPGTTAGSVAYANGPVALVQFTNRGFPAFDTFALLWGLVFAFACAFVGMLAMNAVSHFSFGERIKLIALFAVAIAGYADLGQPIFNHAPWGYALYAFAADVATWVIAGAVLSRFAEAPETDGFGD